MLNWRRAVRWARSADPSERNTDSAADRRGSYLLSSAEESCRESGLAKVVGSNPTGPANIDTGSCFSETAWDATTLLKHPSDGLLTLHVAWLCAPRVDEFCCCPMKISLSV